MRLPILIIHICGGVVGLLLFVFGVNLSRWDVRASA